jgi:voltage-gated sodium channel
VSADERAERAGVPAWAALVAACRRLAESHVFNAAIIGVIVTNAITLGLQTYDAIEADYGSVLDLIDGICLGIFVVELTIRFLAVGANPRRFFSSGWNTFDFIVVGGAFVPGVRENATVLRLLRLARIVRVIRLLPDLRVLVAAVGRSLPGMLSLVVMGGLTLYLYGMVGWVLFHEQDPEAYGTIGKSMLTLFVLLSLEGLPEAIANGREITGWAVPYYVSFVLVASLLLLNILIGIVINSMEEAREMEWQREMDERRQRAAATHDMADDHEIAIVDRLAALRRALEDLESEIRSGSTVPLQPEHHGPPRAQGSDPSTA